MQSKQITVQDFGRAWSAGGSSAIPAVTSHRGSCGTWAVSVIFLGPITSFTRVVERQAKYDVPMISANEAVRWMRDDGLPVAVIADIANVERKTVYAWLNGGQVRLHNEQRLIRIHALLSEGKQADLRNLYRFWNRDLDTGATLGSLLSSVDLDLTAIRAALQVLWPLARRQASTVRQTPHGLDTNPYLRDTPEVSSTRDE